LGDDSIQRRKADHLRVVAEEDVLHTGSNLLDCVQLVHNALPELGLDDIDTSTEFFGKPLRLPLMITSMTGGEERGAELNTALARVAADTGIALAVGSQRVMLKYRERAADFKVREEIPDSVLLANIGGQQLTEYPLDKVRWLVDEIEADGICVHLNPAHELAQPEGDRDFAGVLEALAKLCASMPGKVLVKEVGHGLGPETVKRLANAGVKNIDVAGGGGTSWTKVEARRAKNPDESRTGIVFGDWGIPTAPAVIAARDVAPDATIIASGGINTGLDMARAIAIGADLCGLARPLLLAYQQGGEQACSQLIEQLGYELRCTLLLTGSRDLAALRGARRVYTSSLAEWVDGLSTGKRKGE
jgi:isopentenyl-diphosphate delta-isomerase